MDSLKTFWTNHKDVIITVLIAIPATCVAMWSFLKWKKKIR